MSDDAPTDRHGLEVLNLAQCLALLHTRPLGRLAYVDAGQPAIVPVNFLVDGSAVVLRSFSGGKLDAAVIGAAVAFEVDDHDPSENGGWSVLVRGRADLVDDPSDVRRFETQLDSWAIEDPSQGTWIRIIADEISGRRVIR